MSAKVILLAGPSGCGKSTLARRSGLPLLELDHFYRDGDAPDMPRHQELDMIDWDHIDAWDLDSAMAALTEVCRTGRTQVPVYDISRDARLGTETFDLHGAQRFIAEGIFAADLIEPCRTTGILADAIVLQRKPWKNFLRRLARDLQQQRKPPLDLIHRGQALRRAEPALTETLIGKGCRPLNARETINALR